MFEVFAEMSPFVFVWLVAVIVFLGVSFKGCISFVVVEGGLEACPREDVSVVCVWVACRAWRGRDGPALARFGGFEPRFSQPFANFQLEKEHYTSFEPTSIYGFERGITLAG